MEENVKTGLEQITEERVKQIVKHGYTANNDAKYKSKELLFCALAYLNAAIYGDAIGNEDWPFGNELWKYEGYVESLKKAGAFIAAELDRIRILNFK